MKQIHELSQSCSETMIISIAILLLARRVFSSLPVQGSISVFNKNTALTHLHANKLVDDNLNKSFENVKKALLEEQIHLTIDVGGNIHIEEKMTDGKNDKQNYLEMDQSNDFDRMSLINPAELKYTRNYPMIATLLMLKEMIDDISNVLRRVTLMHDYNAKREKLVYQNLFYNENLPQYAVSQEHSMNFNEILKQFEVQNTLINDKFTSDTEKKWNSKSELEIFFEYTKSIQDNLLWLSRLLDAKRHELHHIFDNVIRWKLLNVKKQMQFLLENLIEKQQQSKKIEIGRYQEFSKDGKSTSTVSSIENIKSQKATTLNTTNKETFNKTDKAMSLAKESKANITDNDSNKPREVDGNVTNDRIASKVEMRILSSEILKNVSKLKSKRKNSAIKADPANKNLARTNSINIANETKKIIASSNNSEIAQVIKLQDRRNQFNQLKNVSVVFSSKIKTALTENRDKQNQKRTNTAGRGSLNVTKTPASLSRRTLQIPGNRNKGRTQQGHHVKKHGTTNYHGDNYSNAKLRTPKSTIDKILEAVNGILPTLKPDERSKVI